VHLKKNNGNSSNLKMNNLQLDITSLGEMDETPFDLEYIKKNHTAQWEHLEELRAFF
jgi:hypothetical protein